MVRGALNPKAAAASVPSASVRPRLSVAEGDMPSQIWRSAHSPSILKQVWCRFPEPAPIPDHEDAVAVAASLFSPAARPLIEPAVERGASFRIYRAMGIEFPNALLLRFLPNDSSPFGRNMGTRDSCFCSGHQAIDIVVVGGGVAGLATALALHRIGLKSLVLGRSDCLRASGMALILWANAWKALEALGVADTLRAGYCLLDGTGVYQNFELYSEQRGHLSSNQPEFVMWPENIRIELGASSRSHVKRATNEDR